MYVCIYRCLFSNWQPRRPAQRLKAQAQDRKEVQGLGFRGQAQRLKAQARDRKEVTLSLFLSLSLSLSLSLTHTARAHTHTHTTHTTYTHTHTHTLTLTHNHTHTHTLTHSKQTTHKHTHTQGCGLFEPSSRYDGSKQPGLILYPDPSTLNPAPSSYRKHIQYQENAFYVKRHRRHSLDVLSLYIYIELSLQKAFS